MNAIYEQNLQIVKERHPHLYNALEAPCPFDTVYEVSDSRSGVLTMQVNVNGQRLFLHSQYDPVTEASRIVAGFDLARIHIVVVMGLGLAYHVEALLANYPRKLVVVEPDINCWKAALAARDLQVVLSHPCVDFVASAEPIEVRQRFFRMINLREVENMKFCWLPPTVTYRREFYLAVQQEILHAIQRALINTNTLNQLGPNFIMNSWENFPAILNSPGIAVLANKFPNKPAIIVSSGPSLNKNVHLLHEAKGRAVIICAGTAYKAVLKHGIKPDFVVSIDSQPINYEAFRDINCPEVCLIAEPQVYPDIVKTHAGRIMIASSGNPVVEWLRPVTGFKGSIPSGGSVAHTAFSVACYMGADPIIFIGQDLSYSPENRTHADGTIHEKVVINDEKHPLRATVKLKGNYVSEVYAPLYLHQFLQWFEEAIRRNPGRKYINATEGGAYITGTEIATFRETIDTYCREPVDVQGVLDDIFHQYIPPDNDQVLKLLGEIQDDFKDIIVYSNKAAKACDKLVNMVNGKAGSASLRKGLRQLERMLERITERKRAIDFIGNIVDGKTYAFIRHLNINDVQDPQEILQGYKKMYQDIAQAAQKLGEATDRVANILKAKEALR